MGLTDDGSALLIVIELPVAPVGTPVPLGSDATGSLTAIVDRRLFGVPDCAAAAVKVATATAPTGMVALFMPLSTQVYEPAAVLLHWRDLPAPLEPGAAVTVTAVKSAGE